MHARVMSGGKRFNFDKVEIDNKTRIKVIKRIWKYLKKHPFNLLFILFASILLVSFNLSIPFILRFVIDDYIKAESIDITVIALIVFGIIIGSIIVSITNYIEQVIITKLASKVALEIRRDAFNNLLNLPIKYFDQNPHGVIMSNLTNDVDTISTALTQFVPQFLIASITIIGAIVLMFFTSWQLALVAISIIPIMVVSTIFVSKMAAKQFQTQQDKIGTINGLVKEGISGLKVVKLYNQEEEMKKTFSKANEELRVASFKGQIYSGMMMPIIRLVDNILYGVIVSVGAIFFINFGIGSVGRIQAITNYAKMATRPINSMAQVYNLLQIAIAGGDRVFNLIDETDEYLNNLQHEIDLVGNVKFKNVNFSYLDNQPVLKNINFEAKAGQTIAIVGPTGGGKTTIINLLMRFYDPIQGEIIIDDKNILALSKKNLRKQIGIVLQTTYLFKGSIMDNIKYGKKNANDEEVIEAAKKAQVYDIIERLPKKYRSRVKEGGINFSHGERQLISIARTILANPAILILDEATSSVDTRTEIKIQKSINMLLKQRTSFVIAHRLQTIKNADNILVIKDGMIIENGTHDELLKQKGFYYDMYTTQFAISEV
ncbi:MAG: ABC transporter ATP-binding protein [Bacilli bacterium]